ncbi:MAG: LegC family aminotransferase [Bacteroidota bacterium]|nr:LegC family aminotransferase [Bacteroidota bacterium]
MIKTYLNITSYIRELYQEPEEFIPLHAPVFHGNEKKYLEDCIDSTFVSSVGKYVDQFEHKVAKYTGAKKAIVTVNGTNALHLALKIVGVDYNTEVITQPLTFIATANAISYCGAKPVFLDVDKDTLGLSPSVLKDWLSKNAFFDKYSKKSINKHTKRAIAACVPMHTFGLPCRIDEIVALCDAYNIPVVEDAAESLGSFYKGKHTGTFGKLGVLSFNGNKTITTGGGGMILTNNEKLGAHIKHITTQAKVPHPWEYAHDEIGYNYRMPNINAALGVAQMEYLDKIIENKRSIAIEYQHFFENSQIKFISELADAKANYWLNAIQFPDYMQREAFLKYSNENAVMTRPIWKLMCDLPMFQMAETDSLTNSKWLAERIVNLPSSVRL